MKSNKFKMKLSLNKRTIAILDRSQLSNINGGQEQLAAPDTVVKLNQRDVVTEYPPNICVTLTVMATETC